MNKPITPEVRAEIVAALREGKSQGQAARQAGVSQPAVHRIAKAEGLDGINIQQTSAAVARRVRDYNHEERLDLINEGLEHLRKLLGAITSPQLMERWSMSLCQLVDKRRLEEGEVTSRTESISSAGARERVESQIDRLSRQLAQRRVALPSKDNPAPSPDTADTDTDTHSAVLPI